MRYGGISSVVIHWHLYGDDGPQVRDREQPAWAAWAAQLATSVSAGGQPG